MRNSTQVKTQCLDLTFSDKSFPSIFYSAICKKPFNHIHIALIPREFLKVYPLGNDPSFYIGEIQMSWKIIAA